MITSSDTMIEFFFTILEHVCPLFVQIAQMSLILPRRGLILPRKPPATPVLYSASKPLLGICTYTKHPKTPPQNTPFPCLKLKVGKTNYCLGKMDPNWAKILKSGKTFLEMGKKIIHSHVDVGCGPATWHWQLLSTKLVLLARHWQQIDALY